MHFDWHPPSTVSALAGYAGSAFLIAIGWHSLTPYQPIGATVVSVLIVIGIVIALTSWKKSWLRLVAVCLLAFAIGLWRFDAAIPHLPKNLIPLSPKGLAYVSADVATADQTDPRYWLGRARKNLDERAAQIFSTNQAALLTGILYGNHQLPKDLKNSFRQAGLLHIVAVSGSNVTILVVLIMPLLLALRLSRRVAFGVLTVALVAFVLFVAPSASVMRAAIMGWLIELAPLVGRIPRPSRLLLISAVVFTFWIPWSLMFDASFALSFLAMWGLLTWGRRIADEMSSFKWKTLVQIFGASCGASIMTMPYTLWAFGQFTVWGLLTGILALPLIPWVTCFGVIALILPPAISFARWPAEGFLTLIIWISQLPAWAGFGYWSKLSTPFSWMISVYTILFLVWRSIKKKKRVIHKKLAS